MAANAASALSNAAAGPDAITVSLPLAAPAAPPLTGASSMRWPLSSSRAAVAAAKLAGTVALRTTTAPRGSAATAPSAPNSTASTCAASTTMTKSSAASRAASAGLAAALPPDWAKASLATLRIS